MRTEELCRTQVRSLKGRAATLMAAAATMVFAIAGTASAGPAELSPEVRAMAQRLAQRDPIQSCAADSPTMLPGSPMFAAGGAVGAVGDSGPLTVGGPGGLWVQCSLAYTVGKSGGDCEGKHLINWQVLNGGTNPTVVAELLAIDTQGNVLKSFNVKQGQNVQLNSRLSPSDWKFTTNKGTYDIFAPVGMLHVKVTTTTGDTADAYCTGIPYVDVIKPNGGVVTDNGGGGIDFKAAVPRTDLSSLQLKVDGINILPLISTAEGGGLGISHCTYLSPCDGTLPTLPPLSYSNLIIDVAPNVGTLSANVIQGTLTGLGCGGHFIRATTSADPLFRRTSSACNLDDLNDRGAASIFGITLTELGGKSGNDLVDGLTTTQTPTEVVGQICSGTDILTANINGLDLNVSGQVKVPGSGDVGDKVTLDFDKFLPQTDLKADFAGTTTGLGTFAPGSNRLLIAATEKTGMRAYERLMFGIGDNLKPLGIDPSAVIATDVLNSQITEGLKESIQAKMQGALSPTETTLNNAFILGLSASGAQQILDNLCTNPNGDGKTLRDIFAQAVSDALDDWPIDHPLSTYDFHPPCSCNSDNIPIYVSDWSVGDSFSCPIKFEDHKLTVSLVLPDLTVTLRTDKDQECFANHTNVHAFVKAGLTGVHFDYVLLEKDIKDGTTSPGAGFKVEGKAQLDAHSDIDYGVIGDVCDWFIDTFVTILTFGQVDLGPLLEPDFSFQAAIDITKELSPAKPKAIPIDGFRIDEQTNGVYHQKLSGEISLLSDVHISGQTGGGVGNGPGAGITVGLKGTFATTSIDPLVENNPGYQAKEPPLPTMQQLQDQGGKDALIGLSVDVMNTMFQGLGKNGDMKVGTDPQGCFPLVKTLGDLLPANCESIDIDPNTASPAIDDIANGPLRAWCHAVKGDNCQAISFAGNPDIVLNSTERGLCWGAQGLPVTNPPTSCWDLATDPVSHLTDLIQYGACVLQPPLNLHHDQSVQFCAKADIPIIQFPTEGATLTSVPTDLQINDISVSLVLDRGGTGGVGGPDGHVTEPLGGLPGCFGGTQTTTDCNIFSACLDVDMKFAMNTLPPNNTVCADGKPGFQAQFTSLLPHIRKLGEVCSGGASTNDSDALAAASDSTAITQPIGNNAAVFAPPICGTGLVTPLFTCDNLAILGLDAGIVPDFKEFLAVTCELH